ncbi:hypothetical protein DFH27DRAFT_615187 [Peziza echinospora]|nr:hypothetical protein DFH27DRAFT_615187 [Peziza echinospora]
MSDFSDRRAPLFRSTTAASSPALGYAVGDIPPELSPLDELAIRGRMLRKQLATGNTGAGDGRVGLTPQSIHRSLRRSDRSPSAAEPGYLERSFSLDSQGAQQSFARRIDGIGMAFNSVNDDDRPTSSQIRFSNVSSSSSSRDSTSSVLTIRPEHISGYMDRDYSPNLQDNPDRHNAQHQFDYGRDSIKPSIQNVYYEEPESSTQQSEDHARLAGIIGGWPHGQGQGARKSEVPTPPVRHDSGHEASESEHVSLQDHRASPMIRLGSHNNSNVPAPPRSPGLPPMRQGSSGQTYQAYTPGNNQQPPPRKQPSREEGLRAPPVRKDSRDSARNSPQLSAVPMRTGVVNHNSDNTQSSILPMLSQIRAASPDGMSDRSSYNLGPPSPLPQMGREPSNDNYDWLHDFTKSTGQSSERPQSSASQMSSFSVNGSRVTSKAINFSRPMLNPRPSIDVSFASDNSNRPSYMHDHSPLNTPGGANTPGGMHTPAGARTPIGTAETHDGDAVTSYTYLKYYLPRGRALDRNSIIFTDVFTDVPGQNEGPARQNDGQPRQNEGQLRPNEAQLRQNEGKNQLQAPRSLSNPQTPTSEHPQNASHPPQNPVPHTQSSVQHSQPPPPPPAEPIRKQSYAAYTPSAPVTPIGRSFTSPSDKGQSDYVSKVLRQQPHRPANLNINTNNQKPTHLNAPGAMSPNPNRGLPTPTSSGLLPPKTPRPTSSKENLAPSSALTPEEHVNLGIECHEKGSLQQSSYHLRCAANAGHPTGMLLYALSLRHGWGMKANPKEAIDWLKKVIHLAGEDINNSDMDASTMDFFEKKGRKAQFALSVYELGMCHLNGWGTDVDKAYALKCFEIAGKWGDADALSEAGYCYYHGVGTKKDLKKSARYYRMAESKGVNMVGNSWIWKEKYLDDDARREIAQKARDQAKKDGKPEPPLPAEASAKGGKADAGGGGGFFNRKKDKH